MSVGGQTTPGRAKQGPGRALRGCNRVATRDWRDTRRVGAWSQARGWVRGTGRAAGRSVNNAPGTCVLARLRPGHAQEGVVGRPADRHAAVGLGAGATPGEGRPAREAGSPRLLVTLRRRRHAGAQRAAATPVGGGAGRHLGSCVQSPGALSGRTRATRCPGAVSEANAPPAPGPPPPPVRRRRSLAHGPSHARRRTCSRVPGALPLPTTHLAPSRHCRHRRPHRRRRLALQPPGLRNRVDAGRLHGWGEQNALATVARATNA